MTEKAEMVSAVASKATYAGTTTTVFGWAVQIDAVAAMGLILAVLGFLVNSYFSWRRDRREKYEHKLRVQQEKYEHELKVKNLKGQCNVEQD
ncbi:holin [Acinetobacter baumannii]|uniref:holin n=1 Tax=Acinetobacter baumannii TaxID=470 RepID=UPI00063B37B0|nr:holin [Acinetobacter baumannii]KKZ46573.1 hypothetical protein UO01_12580 [Acinetobacter baumannii]MCF4430200.1 holin [Acinetobacter baumannii]MCF4452931.1 holin [Acinetobacter baumannii]MCF4490855.1 holin [Acinetobacter baumannii]MCF4530503.1 holin [Acinetobacter baumannii]